MAERYVTRNASIEKKLDGARQLRQLIARHRERSDEPRQLAQSVVEALAGLGLFRSKTKFENNIRNLRERRFVVYEARAEKR